MRLFFLFAVWLGLSTILYAGLLRFVRAYVHAVPVLLGIGLVCATILSPGVAVGHGVTPFPGGLVCLGMLFTEAPQWRGLFLNLGSWLLTTALFLVVTLRRPTPH